MPDPETLRRLAEREGPPYRSASPFPHCVLDGLLPGEVVDRVIVEFPGRDDIAWDLYDEHTVKLATSDPAKMGPATRHVIDFLNGHSFVRFLEELTGIDALVPDPGLHGGGLHLVPNGGHLDVHADFNYHRRLQLHRRLNLLLYLNDDWDPDWGGHLELWSATERVRSVIPEAGRIVVFTTTDTSFHGHPAPLRCPPERARQSLALYYYTAAPPPMGTSDPHSTIWRDEPATPHAAPSATPTGSGVTARRKGWRLARRAKAAIRARMAPAARAPAQAAPTAPGSASGPDVDLFELNHWERLVRLFDRIHPELGEPARPHYLWSLLHAADAARVQGRDAITALEFGVAGGRGLVAMERAAVRVSEAMDVEIAVHGFDSGEGLPEPVDSRDAPYLMRQGDFPMDHDRLRDRLDHAQLHLGLIRDTLGPWLAAAHPPVGFVAVDVDYWSSTLDVLQLFLAPAERLLPRVLCYFDDVLGYPWGDSNGERRAVADFTAANQPRRVIDQLHGLRWQIPRSQFERPWPEMMFLAHVTDHPAYGDYEGFGFGSRLDLDG